MTGDNPQPKTLYDKVFEAHVVHTMEDGTCVLYIDRHLVHEVTSPQAFEGLRAAGRTVRRPDCTLATVDHNTPTTSRASYRSAATFIDDAESRNQCLALETNVKEFGLTYFGLDDKRQGIVHVIGPEQGFTLPGTTIVCGDSHTATHGAFGALAFGIGTSDVEHVLATQTLLQRKSKNMLVTVEGDLADCVTSKDVILHVIGRIGTAGGTGHVIEFAGNVFSGFSMEARMSVCNMAIEAGARAGMIAPDETAFEYIRGRPFAPSGDLWNKAVEYWKTLASDEGAWYDKTVKIDARDIAPTVTWGTSPQDVVPITGRTPNPNSCEDPVRKEAIKRSLQYMGLEPDFPMESIKVDKVFIGSCTNSRIEDLRAAAAVIVASRRKVAQGVHAMIVPGSGLVKVQAEQEGLDKIFVQAGFDWREAGCSMCLGMNPDQLKPGERCASTSNRNFEGRQGPGGRTHLVSPAMAAAAAIEGRLADVRVLLGNSASEAKRKIDAGATDSKAYLGEYMVTHPPAVVSSTPQETAAQGGSTDAATSSGSALQRFVTLTGIPAPLPMSNVDTDMIIPKQFLKTTKRTGLGKSLFYEIRYDPATGSPNPKFVLNNAPYNHASILLAGENFGCGSSREHAPWALRDFGITCIIAPSFADIFYHNCFKNGMLPVVLPPSVVGELMELATTRPGEEITVDLVVQEVRYAGKAVRFDVEAFRKHCLLNGLDDIGITMSEEPRIALFEKRRSEMFPWLDGPGYGRAVAGNRILVPAPSPAAEKQCGGKTKLEW